MTAPKKTQNFGLPYVDSAELGDMGECMSALVVPDEGGDCATAIIDRELALRARKPTRKIVTIASTDWHSLGDEADEYKYFAIATLSMTFKSDSDYEIELINNNLTLFAKYGFGIAMIEGQSVTIYAVKQPNVSVNLMLSVLET